jgi:hypothetical protein
MVRLRCDVCKRAESYRPARLAAKYGSEIDLDDLLDKTMLLIIVAPGVARDDIFASLGPENSA